MSSLGGPNSQNIGGVDFTVRAVGAAEATAQVDATAGAVQNLGNTANVAAGTGGGDSGGGTGLRGFASALKSKTKSARDAIGAVVGLAGAFTRIIGLAGLAVSAIALLAAGYRKLGTQAKEAAEANSKAMGEIAESFRQERTPASDDAFAKRIEAAYDLANKLSREAADNEKLTNKQRADRGEQITKEYDRTVKQIVAEREQARQAVAQMQHHKDAMEATKNRVSWELKLNEALRERNKLLAEEKTRLLDAIAAEERRLSLNRQERTDAANAIKARAISSYDFDVDKIAGSVDQVVQEIQALGRNTGRDQ